eukprot:GEMP01092627.1.p2 GENE.GEMP01092627.1~~GEMP01092627.1.p2  ORF type:complete len:160 (+),score=29.60 GEMP01092627.1:84-563(+)
MGYESRSRSRGRGRDQDRGRESEPTGKSVLVKNLNYSTSIETLKREFEKFGEVKDVYVPMDFRSQRPKGFGFVEYYKSEHAAEAVSDMDQYRIDGNNVHVCIAQNRRKSPTAMRRREGGGNRRRSPSQRRRRSNSRRRHRRSRSSSRSESSRSPSRRRY